MPFTAYVEHEVVGGKTVLEPFEGVVSYNDPPMTNSLHLAFSDDRDDKRLNYGRVVRATEDTNE